MARRFTMKKLFLLMSISGAIVLNQHAMAAAFQLWETDAATIGNYHAGAASEAGDASTSFYNPAGLVLIKNQQAILGGNNFLTDFRFKGTLSDDQLTDLSTPQPVQAQGGGYKFVPFGHYAAPINDSLVFGVSLVVPFGLQTNYGTDTILRYAATLTSVKVIDVAPTFALALTDKFSVGAGMDIEKLKGEFDLYSNGLDGTNETESINQGSSTGVGYHLGALYQITPETRVGLSYHSKVGHHLKGTSKFVGGLANDALGGAQYTNELNTDVTLPPTTTLSLFHTVNPAWDVMASISYTQWRVFKSLILNNVAGVTPDFISTNNLQVVVYQNYRNSWNYSVGTNYHVNEKWMLRAGVGFDQTPSNNIDRNVQLPDSDRIALALGGHFQATKTIGFDAGWTHVFAMNTRINNNTQPIGPSIIKTNGTITAAADVYGFQVKWDFV